MRIYVMKNTSFVCPFFLFLRSFRRERGRLNISLSDKAHKKKKKKEKGLSFRTSRDDVAKIVSPKADESLMYFSEDGKKKK